MILLAFIAEIAINSISVDVVVLVPIPRTIRISQRSGMEDGRGPRRIKTDQIS